MVNLSKSPFQDDCAGTPTYRDSTCTAGRQRSFLLRPMSRPSANPAAPPSEHVSADRSARSPPLPLAPRPRTQVQQLSQPASAVLVSMTHPSHGSQMTLLININQAVSVSCSEPSLVPHQFRTKSGSPAMSPRPQVLHPPVLTPSDPLAFLRVLVFPWPFPNPGHLHSLVPLPARCPQHPLDLLVTSLSWLNEQHLTQCPLHPPLGSTLLPTFLPTRRHESPLLAYHLCPPGQWRGNGGQKHPLFGFPLNS